MGRLEALDPADLKVTVRRAPGDRWAGGRSAPPTQLPIPKGFFVTWYKQHGRSFPWKEYLAALVDGRDERARYEEEGYSWYALSQCRPTLLEVARAVLEVAKEEFGAVGPGEVAP